MTDKILGGCSRIESWSFSEFVATSLCRLFAVIPPSIRQPDHPALNRTRNTGLWGERPSLPELVTEGWGLMEGLWAGGQGSPAPWRSAFRHGRAVRGSLADTTG